MGCRGGGEGGLDKLFLGKIRMNFHSLYSYSIIEHILVYIIYGYKYHIGFMICTILLRFGLSVNHRSFVILVANFGASHCTLPRFFQPKSSPLS